MSMSKERLPESGASSRPTVRELYNGMYQQNRAINNLSDKVDIHDDMLVELSGIKQNASSIFKVLVWLVTFLGLGGCVWVLQNLPKLWQHS